MKLKSFLITAALGVSITAHAQNTAKSAVTSNIVDQGTRGITAEKTKNTLNTIIDWVGTPSLRRLTIVQLRALNTDWPSAVHVTDANGVFTLDVADLATSDDGVNTLVTTSGAKRYKRVVGTIAAVNGLQTALDTKANAANARLTGQVGVNVTVPGYDVDVADKIRAQNGAVFGSGSINAYAILDLQSTTKVFYPPRMTQAQRLAIASGSPGAGSVVYQSDGTPGLYAFDTSWKRLFTASDALPAAQITGLTKTSVGLGNVDNTADASKPVSSAQQAALDLKLSLAGGNLTGVLGMTNASGLQVYNSSTITSDYERGNIGWQGNVFTIDATRGGTGSLRPVGLKSIANTFNVNPGPSLTGRIFDINAISSVGSGQGIIASTGNISNSAGNTYNTALFSTVNQSGSAGHSELYISPYFQATGGSPRYLIRAGTNTAAGGTGTHTDVFTVSQNGSTYAVGNIVSDGVDGIYANSGGFQARGLVGRYGLRTINDVQSRYSSYDWKINGSADNDYNASYMLQHTHKYDMFASANTYTPLRIFQNKVNIGSNALPSEVLSVAGNAAVTGNIVTNGNLNVGENSDATAKTLNIGNGRTANGTTGINFVSDTGGNSGLSIQRQGSAGVNSRTDIVHRGTGDFNIHAYEAAKIDFATAGTSRMEISGAGNVTFHGKLYSTDSLVSSKAIKSQVFEVSNRKGANESDYYRWSLVDNGSGLGQSLKLDNQSERPGFTFPFQNILYIKDGNVGFNMNNPTTTVDVGGSFKASGNAQFSSNVGIGTATPNAALQFSNTPSNRKIVIAEAVNNDHQIYGFGYSSTVLRYQIGAAGGRHAFYAGTSASASTELATITGGGNFGMGTTSPTSRFHINANSALATITLSRSVFSASTSIGGVGFANAAGAYSSGITSMYGADSTSSDLLFRAGTATGSLYGVSVRMAITSGGRVGINTTTPHASTLVDFVSTTAGVGLPQLTTTQVNAIATPKAGLTVYNTTLNKLCYYNGTAWKQVTDSNM